MLSNAPEIIPLWHFNEDNGTWEEEGQANIVGNNYEGEVSHFFFWNCDVPFELVEIEGSLTDENGNALPDFYVTVKWDNTNFIGSALTNSNGVFKGKVPKDAPLTLHAYHCGVSILERDLGMLTFDTDLGVISVALTDFAKQLTARLLDCTNTPLVNGYATIKNGYRSEILVPDDQGNISTLISGCGQPEIIFKAFDPIELSDTEELQIDVNSNDENLGDIVVCESFTEFIKYTINGGVPNVLLDPEVYLVNDDLIHIKATDHAASKRFEVITKLREAGSANAEELSIGGFDENNLNFHTSCNSNWVECDYTVEFDSDPEVNMNLIGRGSGEVGRDTITGPVLDYIESTFMINVDGAFQTGEIKGMAWVDSNENGIRDMDEIPLPEAYVYMRREDGEPVRNYIGNTNARTDEDGNYSFSGLQPGIAYRVYFSLNYKYEVTDTDVGTDDTLDNDFSEASSGGFESSIITFSDGEVVSSIDLGIVPPEMTASVFYTGCPDGYELRGYEDGGVKPFVETLTDGNGNDLAIQDGRFNGALPGTYTYTVTDALGTVASDQIELPEYKNEMSGLVWVDKPGGDPNVFNLNHDDVLKNFRVELWDDSNNKLATVFTGGDFRYYFRNFDPGQYRIFMQAPGGFEFVEMSVGIEANDSDIDPQTGFSDFFEITDECDFKVAIMAGLKEL